LTVLKNWCSSLCPLGALHGFIGRLNFFVRPKVQKEACLLSRGVNCRACEKACPQEVHPVKIEKNLNTVNCTKCLECYEKCPVRAIQVKLI
jgi:ferredoxin-type protein NapH